MCALEINMMRGAFNAERVLTGVVCDREKKDGGGSSSFSSVQCLALYTALVGDCNMNTHIQHE